MREWMLGIVGASLLSAIALTLCPRGRVRQVTKLVCGLVCTLALASPLLELDYGALSASLAGYRQTAERLVLEEEEEGKLVQRTYIQDECAAYIRTEAERRGLAPDTVSVSALWHTDEAVWYPWEVTIGCPYDGGLAAYVEETLGVPEERQTWTE